MKFAETVINKAKQRYGRIILPEGNDIRIVQAARRLIDEGIASEVLLFADSVELANLSKKAGVSLAGINHCLPEKLTDLGELSAELLRLRAAKGISPQQAEQLSRDPLYAAALMLRLGKTDAVVAGAVNTTAAVLKVGFTVLKTCPGVSTASSFFIMETERTTLGSNGCFLFADCAILPQPNANQLAEIAIQTAASCRRCLGVDPKVALLSFSTKGSADHPLVANVQAAYQLVKKIQPQLLIDGELQLDAAIIDTVAAQKAPDSAVAGQANVLIFPDLQSGNIGYKLVERLAGANAYGPFIQGLAYPISDLSRGCSVSDIVVTAAMTLISD